MQPSFPRPPAGRGFTPQPPSNFGNPRPSFVQPPHPLQQQGFAQPPPQQQGFAQPPPQQQGFAQPPPQQQAFAPQQSFPARPPQQQFAPPPRGDASQPLRAPSPRGGPPPPNNPQNTFNGGPRPPLMAPRPGFQSPAAPRPGFQPPPSAPQPGFQPIPPSSGAFYGTAPNPAAAVAVPPQIPLHPPGFTPQRQPSGSTNPVMAQRGIATLNIEPQFQCPSEFCRFSFERFPESENVRLRAGAAPLAAIFRPFCDLEGTPMVPEVNFSAASSVIRCNRCRAYVSPFATFVDNGRRWQCALCFNVNEVEADYYCEMVDGKRRDYLTRAELCSGAIDIIAPDEYSLRPPPPPVFLFVIDVSHAPLVFVVSQAIKRILQYLPGEPRTQVGFITFDSEVHFYDLSSGSTVRMLVVSELGALFHPTTSANLLLDVGQHMDFVSRFLDELPNMHQQQRQPTSNAGVSLGSAIEAAFDVMSPFGGKMIVFQTQLPAMISEGDAVNHHGGLQKPGRGYDGKSLGGPNEHDLLQPANTWYSQKAELFNRQHISLDWYACPVSTHYLDLATVAELCHLTAGRLRHFPNFHAQRDGERLANDLSRSLTTVCCSEAVMRVRASTGVRVNRFFGSFTMRARDLIALPQSDPDGVYGFEFTFDNESEILPGRFVTFQSAVLYTTLQGERRIRVTNRAIPVSSHPQEVANTLNLDVVGAILFKRAAEEARESGLGLDFARNQLRLSFYKLVEASPANSNWETLAASLVGAIKSSALRGGTDVGFDERYALLRLVGRGSVDRLKVMMVPTLELLGGNKELLPLSRQSLHAEHVYLLNNGLQLLVWVGHLVPSPVLLILFGLDSFAKLDGRLPVLSQQQQQHPLLAHFQEWVSAARRHNPEDFLPVMVVREGDLAMEARFFWGLTRDAQSFRGGEVSVEELMTKGRNSRAGGGGVPGAPRPPGMMGGNPMPAAPLPQMQGQPHPSLQQQPQQPRPPMQQLQQPQPRPLMPPQQQGPRPISSMQPPLRPSTPMQPSQARPMTPLQQQQPPQGMPQQQPRPMTPMQQQQPRPVMQQQQPRPGTPVQQQPQPRPVMQQPQPRPGTPVQQQPQPRPVMQQQQQQPRPGTPGQQQPPQQPRPIMQQPPQQPPRPSTPVLQQQQPRPVMQQQQPRPPMMAQPPRPQGTQPPRGLPRPIM